ncbi:hypothetical protein DE146DRAFT_630660 [Phaeosphaeria sp. MPI-PUGE-AT-0046c]|nr:hypothetical protein DE146DRAFT_630660 [Phaeosphaeria sp. MPI-PUGE-AT-0046c]
MEKQTGASQKPFRVVIVGAGIVGLSLSHALQLANIDHVVLEKHSKIVSVRGAALMIWPGVARILDQFGILKDIQATVTPVSAEYERYPDGSINAVGDNVQMVGKRFELPVILFDRMRCVTHLYDGLPDQSFIRTNSRVDRVEHTKTGVKVYLTDGSVEEGDMVIGADGVHSNVRQLMWEHAAKNEPQALPELDKDALYSDFKAMFGASEIKDMPELGPADVHVVQGYGTTKLVFTQPGNVYWALMYKDEHEQPPKPFRPTQQEQDEIAARFKDMKMVGNITLGDLYKNKTRAGALNLEEGIVSKWHSGRMVLVGDSAHKMTADLGMGANTAIESAIVLVNLLQRALKDDPCRHFSQEEISDLFGEYQETRYGAAKKWMELSGKVTRTRSYESLWARFFITQIAPMAWLQKIKNEQFVQALAKTAKLEFAPTKTINENADGWKQIPGDQSTGAPWVAYALVTSVVGVGLSYAAVLRWGMPASFSMA